MDTAKILAQAKRGFEFNFGNLVFAPTYLQAAAIVFLIFLLILTLAQVRRHLLDWGVKGSIFGVFVGFLLALVLEGFLVLSGRTALTEVLGWKNAPKPIALALDAGRAKLVQVLGTSTQISGSYAKNFTVEEITRMIQSLSPRDSEKLRLVICKP